MTKRYTSMDGDAVEVLKLVIVQNRPATLAARQARLRDALKAAAAALEGGEALDERGRLVAARALREYAEGRALPKLVDLRNVSKHPHIQLALEVFDQWGQGNGTMSLNKAREHVAKTRRVSVDTVKNACRECMAVVRSAYGKGG